MHFLWIVELIALATGIYSFRDVHVVSRSSQAGIENARTACTLLNEALSGLVAYPGKLAPLSASKSERMAHHSLFLRLGTIRRGHISSRSLESGECNMLY